jgi:hypothetical protein
MPEGPEIKIMSDYINSHSKNRTFKKLYHVEKGNIPIDSNLIDNFKLEMPLPALKYQNRF